MYEIRVFQTAITLTAQFVMNCEGQGNIKQIDEVHVKTKSLRSKKLQSLTFLAIIDGQSSELTKGMSPYLDKTPYEGLNPKSPVNVAGFRAEPPVSDPRLL
ncbi:unnamed protein product [Litomosoides sigmodontis]|uniref:Uncharacterized protein n=1 Tax=Litomosoides sigmodontis TaxID=42156 RepID=A0A3P6VD82_LITSI|nr:unnamed protein product [Litomosoides sigmodontis]